LTLAAARAFDVGRHPPIVIGVPNQRRQRGHEFPFAFHSPGTNVQLFEQKMDIQDENRELNLTVAGVA
jgi:hypothetical protein